MVHITDENLLDKFCEVEGERFRETEALRERQYKELGYSDQYSLFGALTAWAQDEDRHVFGFSWVIYGEGGWHRYFVREDGEIVFSWYHSNKSDSTQEKVKAAGFNFA